MKHRLSEVAQEIAEPVSMLVLAHKSSDDRLRKYYHSILNLMVRHLEYFTVPGVSEAAQKLADENGFGDLKLRDYRHLGARRALAWEHHPPVSDLLQRLFELEEPTPVNVRTILMMAGVNWITKSENASLPKNKRGRDPAEGYAHIAMRSECERD